VLLDQGTLAVRTLEANFMPMPFLVGQIFGIGPDSLVTLLARIGEQVVVTFDTVTMVVAKDVPLSRQRVVAVPAAEMTGFFVRHDDDTNRQTSTRNEGRR